MRRAAVERRLVEYLRSDAVGKKPSDAARETRDDVARPRPQLLEPVEHGHEQAVEEVVVVRRRVAVARRERRDVDRDVPSIEEPVRGRARSRAGAEQVVRRAEAARRLKATQDETRSRLRRTSSAVLRGARYILVCGWRPVWTDEAHRLRDRVYQLLDGATPGSQIIFANGLPELKFRELMTGACGFRDVSGADDAVFETALGVQIRHVHGDAADVALLRRIVMNIPIETAIVLGTNARALGDPLAPKMRDTRVLNILLTLRLSLIHI